MKYSINKNRFRKTDLTFFSNILLTLKDFMLAPAWLTSYTPLLSFKTEIVFFHYLLAEH